ncbi:unnamed protein product [Pieris macdunnoughi]|uniref:MADF domain-containing protein n=1 Tax=Pieris macdunnoughi TaxID=345717 RepID=A0A821UL27_9NEOP|nr:unnamed protein product [Pieris macdunnoughi]
MSDWSAPTILTFLEAYQNEPCLWNSKDADHKNRQKVNDAWTRLSIIMNKSVKELKNKKEILMVTFRRHLKKKKDSIRSGAGFDDVYTPVWFAYDLMESFLGPLYSCSNNVNSEENKDENYTEVIYLEDPIESQEESFLKEVQPKGLKRPRNEASEGEISDFGLYITSLLRDLPSNVCAQLQLNIVDLIVKAKLEETGPDISMEVDRGKDPMENENQQNTNTTYQPENLEISTESQKERDKNPNTTPKKRTKLKNDAAHENIIENFGKYVVCLLKTFPRTDTNTKLQKDIVDLIMTARLQTMKNRLTDSTIDKLGIRRDLFVEIK